MPTSSTPSTPSPTSPTPPTPSPLFISSAAPSSSSIPISNPLRVSMNLKDDVPYESPHYVLLLTSSLSLSIYKKKSFLWYVLG